MKKKKTSFINKFFIIIIFLILATFLIGCGFLYYIYLCSPEFDPELLYTKESTNIYDSKGDLITTIGTERRQLVNYEELPQVLIDAIIATEDSRFYEHHGFDIYRFAKAGAGYISGKDAGGASTLTMQVSKNSLTSTESKGFDGIVRKFKDIYLSMFKIEKNYSKK